MSGIKSVLTTFWGVSLAMMISTQLPGQSVTPAPSLEMLPEVSNLEIGSSTTVLAASETFSLNAGDMRRVLGRVEITSSTSGNIYIETYAQCVTPDGTVAQQGGLRRITRETTPPLDTTIPRRVILSFSRCCCSPRLQQAVTSVSLLQQKAPRQTRAPEST